MSVRLDLFNYLKRKLDKAHDGEHVPPSILISTKAVGEIIDMLDAMDAGFDPIESADDPQQFDP